MNTTVTDIEVHIDWFKDTHIPVIEAIEQASFARPMFREELRKLMRTRNCIGLKAEYDGEVVGFMIYELFRTKYELIDLAISPKYRKRGIGRKFIKRLMDKLSFDRRHVISVAVRETNVNAQKFFSAIGLKAVGVARDHFDQNTNDHTITEDAYLFEYSLRSI